MIRLAWVALVSLGLTSAVGSELQEKLARLLARGDWERVTGFEVLTHAPRVIPDGSMEFARSGLMSTGPGTYLWRGRIRISGNKTVPIWVRFRCSVGVEGYRLVRDTRAGDLLQSTDMARGVWSGRLTDSPPAVAARLTDAVLVRSLRRGEVLRERDVRRPPLVHRGDLVSIVVDNSTTRVSIHARALEDGMLRRSILFENPASRKRFRATVTGQGEALIILAKQGG